MPPGRLLAAIGGFNQMMTSRSLRGLVVGLGAGALITFGASFAQADDVSSAAKGAQTHQAQVQIPPPPPPLPPPPPPCIPGPPGLPVPPSPVPCVVLGILPPPPPPLPPVPCPPAVPFPAPVTCLKAPFLP